MKYRLVMFDFDGTLADSFPWLVSVLDHLADKFHYPRANAAEIETLRNTSAKELIEQYSVPVWKMLLMARHVHKLMASDIQGLRLFEGFHAMLRDLSEAGATLAIVSSNSAKNIRQVLGPQTADLFQYYECGVSVFGKAGRFRKILRKCDIPRDEAIYIGDEIRDYEAANKVPIPFGAVSWGYTRVEALQQLDPTEVFASVEDIFTKIVSPRGFGRNF